MRIRRLVAAGLAVLLISTSLPAFAAPLVLPARVDDGFTVAGPPEVSAASWLLYDETADLVIASFAPEEERAMASTTKIMTGLLVLERASMDDMVTVSARAANVGEKEIDLFPGEQVTMEALFKALMIHSANDAAMAIAEHISGSVEEFVALMNSRAAELGLQGTSFANPHGLDAANHHSTAADLMALARVAMEHPEFAQTVQSRALVFPPAPDGSSRTGSATNLLLGTYDGNIGIKTGFTSRAALTFVAAAERDGRRVYAVVLGSLGVRGHFADVTALFDYAFSDYGFVGALTNGTPYEAMRPGVNASPLAQSAKNQALLHLAAQGVLVEGAPDIPDTTDDDAPLRPVSVVVQRQPDQGPALTDLFMYWVAFLFGND